MPPTCKASPLSNGAPRRALSSSLLGALLLALGCGPQNGVVGSEPAPTGGAGGSSGSGMASGGAAGASAPIPTYRTDFDQNGAEWQPVTGIPGASTGFGVQVSGAVDPSTAELRFPGHPEPDASMYVDTEYRTEIASARRFGFGTYRTRLQFGACSPNEETVNATLGYFADETDANQNGITDDEEIDIQVLCGTPGRVFLTVFTDYQLPSAPGGEQFRKLSRAIDFATGDVFDTPASDSDTYTKTDNVAAWVRPELFAANAFYVAGFEWHAQSLRFFLQIDGAEQTLWTLSDPERIPQRPVSFTYNLWHPDSHWFPAKGAAAFPAEDVVMHVDWFEYYAE